MVQTSGMQRSSLFGTKSHDPRSRLAGRIFSSGKGFGKAPPSTPKADKPKAPPKQQSAAPAPSPSSIQQMSSSQSSDPRTRVLEVPEAVNERLLSRMLIFSLVPVFLGIVSLPLLAYIQVKLHVDLPQGTAFAISGLFFGTGLLGITYGILSASWDENVSGSGLGLEEFKQNASPLLDRFKNR